MSGTDDTAQQTGGARQGAGSLLWRWSLRVVVVLLVAVAVLLTLGRALTPLVAVFQDQIEQQLGDMLGTRVAIGDIRGDWHRLGPLLDIGTLQIFNPDSQDGAHIVPNLFIEPDLGKSLMQGRLIIDQVIVEQPELRLTQDASGRWSLAGLAPGGSNNRDTILDFLLTTGRLQVVEASLNLLWADGRELQLDNIFIDLGNTGNVHEARIQARIAGQPSPFQLLATINGDPRNRFEATVYLHANNTDISNLLALPDLTLVTANFSGDLWLNIHEGMLYDVQAAVSDLSLVGSGTGDGTFNTLNLGNASFTASLNHASGKRWQLWLDNTEFDWFSRPWNAGMLYLELLQETSSRPLNISATSIDLAMVADILDDLFNLPELGATALSDLDPAGQLENVLFRTDLDGNMPGGFQLQGNLADVAVGTWQGAPASRGIQGYVQANSATGFVELDASDFEIHLPKLFDNNWTYATANSRVHWQVSDDYLHVNSSIIDVRNDFIHGHVQFDLLNQRDSAGALQSDLILLIGVLEMDASYKSLYLPKLENIRNTMSWLDESLLGGNVTQSGFVSRTSTLGNAPENSGSVMSFYNVTDGNLKFQPQWPALMGIDAFISQDDTNVDVIATSAEIEGMRLGQTVAHVRPAAEGGSWLSIQGSATTSTQLGMAFLRNTPVRNNIGEFIDSWRGEGNIQVDINLGIPINNPQRETDVLVNVTSNLSTLTIPEYSLAIDQLRGRVVYDSNSGLSASALSGRLFDFPIAATIEPILMIDANGDNVITGTRVVGSGRASRIAMQDWEGQPQFVKDLLNFASGEIDYLAEISIPNAESALAEQSGTSLRLSSELLGLSLDLPFPFSKSVDNIRPLELLIDFSNAEQWISVRFDNRVGANLRIEGDQFNGGHVQFGPGVADMIFGPVSLDAAQKLVFRGAMDRFDFNAWQDTAMRFGEFSAGDGAGLQDYLGLVDVSVGRLNILNQELENVRARIQRTGELSAENKTASVGDSDAWLVNLENTVLSGAFLFPDDDRLPWNVNLDYLRFPEREIPEDAEVGAEEEEIDILADVVPGELPDLDFTTLELTVGDKNLGAWEFELRTTGNSATISDLRMTTPDARIRDINSEAGANLDWRYSDGMHTSSFTGLFSAGDLAQVLPGWGYNANVESENAAFVSDLQWSGSPAAFSLAKVVGNVELDINDGRFVDVDSGTSRLFGAFSFDSLVRRLQLDFSDLYEKGLAYDNIRGSLDFDRGIVMTDGGFVIEGPSSRITINGEINLLNETIDADMLVNVPLGQNLSVLAGILGAWPIAVSTFIASRIFRDQMDDFTTVLYRLEGPWENPASGFEPSDEILEAEPVPEAAGQDADTAESAESRATAP